MIVNVSAFIQMFFFSVKVFKVTNFCNVFVMISDLYASIRRDGLGSS